MKKLIKGLVEFRKNLTEENRALFAQLALGQKPDALFIACSDSRVAPNVFASTNPGDLFVLRNVGNLIPPSSSQEKSALAAVEFSVLSLKVSDIIICGHSECGAMQAMSRGLDMHACPNLECWLEYGQEALERVRKGVILNHSLSQENQVSQMNVLLQMEHLLSYPFIRERVKAKQLRIHGWWFDIARADVYAYEEKLNQFVLIDESESEIILRRLGN